MRFLRLAFVLCLAVLAPPALAADFEGMLEMKGTQQTARNPSIPSTWRVFVSPKAARFEIEMNLAEARKDMDAKGTGPSPQDYRMVMLTKVAEPDAVYMIHDRSKTYSIQRVTPADPTAKKQKKWIAQNLGSDRVAGYPCQKFLAKATDSDSEIEGCMSREFFSSEAWAAAMQRGGEGSEWIQALSEQGLKGFPIRMIFRKGKSEVLATYELVKAEKKSLPASTFEIPAGYRKADSMLETAMPPEQAKAMQDAQRKAMEQMTPEQRKQYEEMLRKMGAPTPAPQE